MTTTSNNQQPITILTFTPVWKRPEIFEICLKGIKRLQKYAPERFQIIPFFMVSESWAATLLIKHKMNFLFTANQPLGAKKNAGLKYAFDEYQFDYLMEIGSDDLVTNDYLDFIEPLLKAGKKQFNPHDVYLIDSKTGETAYWKTERIIGLGHVISREAIEKVLKQKWELWDGYAARGMDTFSWRQLGKVGVAGMNIDTKGLIFTLDIKSDVNINKMDDFTKLMKANEHISKQVRTADEILAAFPEGKDITKLIQSFNPSILQS